MSWVIQFLVVWLWWCILVCLAYYALAIMEYFASWLFMYPFPVIISIMIHIVHAIFALQSIRFAILFWILVIGLWRLEVPSLYSPSTSKSFAQGLFERGCLLYRTPLHFQLGFLGAYESDIFSYLAVISSTLILLNTPFLSSFLYTFSYLFTYLVRFLCFVVRFYCFVFLLAKSFI